eukprot:TRINITY_DN31043_c0_g1_i1.p1 TRINITY_DN31043_c0_g1~~TRINITY_DN31043_c0_g1_i1.p1  ORF type:complete len:329 (+),score=48.42 TRINITY_DN31043_c0_g1_i1:56-988(+)
MAVMATLFFRDVASYSMSVAKDASVARLLRAQEPTKKFLSVLLRTGGPNSPERLRSIETTWARDLEKGSLTLLQPDEECKSKYGDNHWKGLTCLEAKNHLRLMNRTDFEWLLVVDDDTYVFGSRLREVLRQLDASKAAVYGRMDCGNCGNGTRGLCGGGGYIVSRQSLLKMASSTTAPVSRESGAAFVDNMMREPDMIWCDVRFGCVAQEKGLMAVDLKGMYGNGITDKKMHYDQREEGKVVDLISEQFPEPPLVLHNVRDAEHMRRVYEESLKEEQEIKLRSNPVAAMREASLQNHERSLFTDFKAPTR